MDVNVFGDFHCFLFYYNYISSHFIRRCFEFLLLIFCLLLLFILIYFHIFFISSCSCCSESFNTIIYNNTWNILNIYIYKQSTNINDNKECGIPLYTDSISYDDLLELHNPNINKSPLIIKGYTINSTYIKEIECEKYDLIRYSKERIYFDLSSQCIHNFNISTISLLISYDNLCLGDIFIRDCLEYIIGYESFLIHFIGHIFNYSGYYQLSNHKTKDFYRFYNSLISSDRRLIQITLFFVIFPLIFMYSNYIIERYITGNNILVSINTLQYRNIFLYRLCIMVLPFCLFIGLGITIFIIVNDWIITLILVFSWLFSSLVRKGSILEVSGIHRTSILYYFYLIFASYMSYNIIYPYGYNYLSGCCYIITIIYIHFYYIHHYLLPNNEY